MEISCLHGKQRGYTVDVKVFFSCFLFSFLYFQNRSISDSFWFVSLFVCLFFCTCTVVCTYKLGTRVMNSQIFRCTKYLRYMFHFLIIHSTLPSKSYLWIQQVPQHFWVSFTKKNWVWRFKQKGYGVVVNHSSSLFFGFFHFLELKFFWHLLLILVLNTCL